MQAQSTRTPPGEPDRSLRISVWEGCASALFGALTGGAVATAFAMAIGANDFHLGLASALGTVSAVGGLLGAQAASRAGSRKRIVVRAALVSRLVLALAAGLPFLPCGPLVRVYLFLVLTAVSGFTLNLAVNPWLSWMTDLVPASRRGRYFAWRNTAVNALGMAAAYGIGRIAVALQRMAAETGLPPAYPFVPFFAASAVFSLLGGWAYLRQWEPPMAREPVLAIPAMLRIPFRNPAFRKFLVFSALWAAALGLAGPFFAPHMLRNLHMGLSGVAFYSIVSGVCALGAQPLWGRVADRIGHRPVLAGNLAVVALLPLIWLPARSGVLAPIWTDAVLTGLFWPGLNLALFNLALGTAPSEHRASHLAVQSLLSGFAGALGAAAGGAAAQAIGDRSWTFGRFELVNFHALFILTSVLRLALLPLALRLTEDRAHTVSAVVRIAGDKASRLFADGMESGIAVLRRWSRR